MGGYNQLTVIDRQGNVLIGSYGVSMGEHITHKIRDMAASVFLLAARPFLQLAHLTILVSEAYDGADILHRNDTCAATQEKPDDGKPTAISKF